MNFILDIIVIGVLAILLYAVECNNPQLVGSTGQLIAWIMIALALFVSLASLGRK